MDNDDFTVAIIGGGSAAEALISELADSDHRVVVFEPDLVGGECPFYACMPSKAMLHDRAVGRRWDDAVKRRNEVVDGLDDTSHVDTARELGATIVRARAEIAGPGTVRAEDGTTYRVDHVVIATGADPNIPEIDGLDADHDRVWTSDDALTAVDKPESVVMIGGGVIGSELAYIFAGFGSTVTTLESMDRRLGDFHPRVSELVEETLRAESIEVVNGVEIERVDLDADAATVHLADGRSYPGERLLVAVGRSPSRHGLGLETLGVDPDEISIDQRGRLVADADHDVWFAGDAFGGAQYTHVANHHAAVVADQLIGSGTRRYDDVTVPACMFIQPPVITVGPSWADLEGDADVVWAEIDLSTPRSTTDELGPGFLAVAARRSTGCVVAANGMGARFDEVIHALVVAIDGEVPVTRLTQTMQPFPTVGEVLGEAFAELARALSS